MRKFVIHSVQKISIIPIGSIQTIILTKIKMKFTMIFVILALVVVAQINASPLSVAAESVAVADPGNGGQGPPPPGQGPPPPGAGQGPPGQLPPLQSSNTTATTPASG